MTVAVAVWRWNRCILATDWRGDFDDDATEHTDTADVGGENAWLFENPSDRTAIEGTDTRMVGCSQ